MSTSFSPNSSPTYRRQGTSQEVMLKDYNLELAATRDKSLEIIKKYLEKFWVNKNKVG